jgi:hypothetical protein
VIDALVALALQLPPISKRMEGVRQIDNQTDASSVILLIVFLAGGALIIAVAALLSRKKRKPPLPEAPAEPIEAGSSATFSLRSGGRWRFLHGTVIRTSEAALTISLHQAGSEVRTASDVRLHIRERNGRLSIVRGTPEPADEATGHGNIVNFTITDRIRTIELRKETRTKVLLDVQIRSERERSDAPSRSAQVTNLSPHGAEIRLVGEGFAQKDRLLLNLKLDQDILDLVAVVRWSGTNDRDVTHIGVEFESIPDAAQFLLADHLASVGRRPAARPLHRAAR